MGAREGGGGAGGGGGEQLGNSNFRIQLWILPYKPGRNQQPRESRSALIERYRRSVLSRSSSDSSEGARERSSGRERPRERSGSGTSETGTSGRGSDSSGDPGSSQVESQSEDVVTASSEGELINSKWHVLQRERREDNLTRESRRAGAVMHTDGRSRVDLQRRQGATERLSRSHLPRRERRIAESEEQVERVWHVDRPKKNGVRAQHPRARPNPDVIWVDREARRRVALEEDVYRSAPAKPTEQEPARQHPKTEECEFSRTLAQRFAKARQKRQQSSWLLEMNGERKHSRLRALLGRDTEDSLEDVPVAGGRSSGPAQHHSPLPFGASGVPCAPGLVATGAPVPPVLTQDTTAPFSTEQLPPQLHVAAASSTPCSAALPPLSIPHDPRTVDATSDVDPTPAGMIPR